MYDDFIMIAIGLVLILVSFLAKGIGYGMFPGKKPIYSATLRLRVILFSFGLLSLTIGLVRVLCK